MTQNPHAPNRFGSYCQIHYTVLEQFKARDFIQEDSLQFSPSNGRVRLYGEISCLRKILILVDKYLEVVPSTEDRRAMKLPTSLDQNCLVQTVAYSYNISVQNIGNIFRYDNQDDYWVDECDHADNHHVHKFEWERGDQKGSVIWVGENDWPTLGDIIEEAEEWYWQQRHRLPEPDSYAVLGLSQSRVN